MKVINDCVIEFSDYNEAKLFCEKNQHWVLIRHEKCTCVYFDPYNLLN